MMRYALLFLFLPAVAMAQPSGFNYDESKVPQFTLPDPLTLSGGGKVTDAKTWETKRRPEIFKLFQTHMYGTSPAPPEQISFNVTSVDQDALDGTAVRKEVTIQLGNEKDGPRIHLLVYLPKQAPRPVPTFLTLNFRGNHSIHPDPGITLSQAWMPKDSKSAIVDHRATEKSRGARGSRWAIGKILKRGYALATIYCGDIDPDYHDGFKNGVHALHPKESFTKNGDNWSTIGAWAWGLSRGLDYFETDDDIDHKRVAVMGHSRLGKTSLWAGASDERFALVISNDSGCGGAALSRRKFGETVKRINTSFPHWFCENFKKYNDNENSLPLDQHMLVALIAPRPVYIASAEGDRWADPRGEFLSAQGADPVYRLLGTSGLPAKEHPAVNHPVMGRIGYHIRSGVHDVTPFDWEQYLNFADKHLRSGQK